MKELIKELESLIIKPKKGCSGHTVLRGSEMVTAHKINKIINTLKSESVKAVKIRSDGNVLFDWSNVR
jgi:hypothetical protein